MGGAPTPKRIPLVLTHSHIHLWAVTSYTGALAATKGTSARRVVSHQRELAYLHSNKRRIGNRTSRSASISAGSKSAQMSLNSSSQKVLICLVATKKTRGAPKGTCSLKQSSATRVRSCAVGRTPRSGRNMSAEALSCHSPATSTR